MCLTRIKKTKMEHFSGRGWKVFRKYQTGRIANFLFSITDGNINNNDDIKFYSWYTNKRKIYQQPAGFRGHQYKVGFHIFELKKDAEELKRLMDEMRARASREFHQFPFEYIVLPVVYQEGHTKGWQNKKKTIVADKIMVLESQVELSDSYIEQFLQPAKEDVCV